MSISTVGIDADDTLWHNEKLFRQTEELFVELLQDYADPTLIKDKLFTTIKCNLPLYGYGIKGFMLSMMETALTLVGTDQAASIMKQILDAGHVMLSYPVSVIDGAEDCLKQLKKDYRLILISKGDLFDQERKLQQSGLSALFDAVEIVSDKNPDIYEKLFKTHGRKTENAVMVGNSLKSDILPALEVGAWAVYVPYEVTWILEQADEPINNPRYHKIDALNELPNLLQQLS